MVHTRLLAHTLLVAALAWLAVRPAGAADRGPAASGLKARPHLLLIADTPGSEALAEYYRHVLPARVTFAALEYGHLEFHHLCDKPLEEPKDEVASVKAKARAFVERQLERLDTFDAVIAHFQPAGRREICRRLAGFVRGGGRLVFINSRWETRFADTPLGDVMPALEARRKSWVSSPGPAGDHPITRGLATERLGTKWYGPAYAAADANAVPLTLAGSDRRGPKHAQYWYRRLPAGGQIVHLYALAAGRHDWNQATDYAHYAADRPDDQAVWNHLNRRLFAYLLGGPGAMGVSLAVSHADPNAPAVFRNGQPVELLVDVENHTARRRTVTLRVRLGHRRTDAAATVRREVTLGPGERRRQPVTLTATLPCTNRFVRVSAEAIDGDDRVLRRSFFWADLHHDVPVAVELSADRALPGDTLSATAVLDANARPGAYRVQVGAVDHAGRAVTWREADAAVAAGRGGRCEFRLPVPGRGPKQVGSYWVTAVVRSAGGAGGEGASRILGVARRQLHVDEPWHMRRRFEWSVWSNGATPRMMALYRHAGFNALGMQGHNAQADRYGLRQYVESTGVNTFAVKIDKDNWPAVRKSMTARIDKLNAGGRDARTKSLVSLGEESGFGGGWGQRFYWKDRETAPPVPQRVFDAWLRERYGGDLDELNRQWGTDYASFDDIPLAADRVRSPGRVFVDAQAWEAARKKGGKRNADRLPVAPADANAAGGFLAHAAPYLETHGFFDAYYQRYCDLATEIYRARRNPVPRTIISAPGGFYPKVDVPNYGAVGPFYPKERALVENAVARRDYGDTPGFSAAMWAYFDLRSLWRAAVLSKVLAGNTHIDYWVDVPLTFNADVTHTRASFWTRILRKRLRPVEPVLLHKRIRPTPGLAMFTGRQPLPRGLFNAHFRGGIHCNTNVYSALMQSGWLPRAARAEDLADCRVLVACYPQVVTAEQARRLAAFVRGGGTLICTPWAGMCSPHGNPYRVYPSPDSPLGELLGVELLNASQAVTKRTVRVELPDAFGLDGPLELLSMGRDEVRRRAGDVETLAAYDDGQPLLTRRAVGEGRVLYLNLVPGWQQWWNTFHEPTRESYRLLIDALVGSDGRLRRDHAVTFVNAEAVDDNKGWWGMKMTSTPPPGGSVPWWASQVFADPSGTVRYLAIFTDHRSPKITADVRLFPREDGFAGELRAFDLLAGRELEVRGGRVRLTLRPGEGAFWAITPHAPSGLTLDAPARAAPGEPVRLRARLGGIGGGQGHFGLVVDAFGPDGRFRRSLSPANITADGGRAEIVLPRAANERAGRWRFVVTESVTRAAAEAEIELPAGRSVPSPLEITPFPPRPGEHLPLACLGHAEFLRLLERLGAIYAGAYEGLEAKYALSYYLHVPFRPDSRHGVVRRLQRVPWRPHVEAVADALRDGSRLLLVGEDVNRDPATGEAIDPLAACDADAFLAALAGVKGARRQAVTAGGIAFDVIAVGPGRLAVADASVDRTAYHSSDVIAWHERLKRAVAELDRRLESAAGR